MITNISDRKDTKFLLYNNTLSVEIKFHWQIIAFFVTTQSFLSAQLVTTLSFLSAQLSSKVKVF